MVNVETVCKKIISVLLVCTMVVSANTAFAANDAKENLSAHWAGATMLKWNTNGWLKGYDDGNLYPDNEVKRSEIAKLINVSFGFTGNGSIEFNDVNAKDWFYNDVKIASAKGYMTGFPDGSFRPHDNITRAQMAVIVSKIAPSSEAAAKSFADESIIPSWAKDAVMKASKAGYMVGFPDGTFKADKVLSRAEAVAVLDNVKTVNNKNTNVSNEANNKKESGNSGKGGGGSSISGKAVPTEIYSISDLEDVIKRGEYATLKKDLAGDLAVNRDTDKKLVLNFENYKLDGIITINAPKTKEIEIKDTGLADDGATIKKLIINAPDAHIAVDAKIMESIDAIAVADSTLEIHDVVPVINMKGAGKIYANPHEWAGSPNVVIDTEKRVILKGKIDTVDVNGKSGNVFIEYATTIKEITVNATKMKLSTNANLNNLNSNSNDFELDEGRGYIANINLKKPNTKLVIGKNTRIEKINVEKEGNIIDTKTQLLAIDTEKSLEIKGDGSVEKLNIKGKNLQIKTNDVELKSAFKVGDDSSANLSGTKVPDNSTIKKKLPAPVIAEKEITVPYEKRKGSFKLIDMQEGAKYFYSLNGTLPTEPCAENGATEFRNPVESCVLKVIAKKEGYEDSEITVRNVIVGDEQTKIKVKAESGYNVLEWQDVIENIPFGITVHEFKQNIVRHPNAKTKIVNGDVVNDIADDISKFKVAKEVADTEIINSDMKLLVVDEDELKIKAYKLAVAATKKEKPRVKKITATSIKANQGLGFSTLSGEFVNEKDEIVEGTLAFVNSSETLEKSKKVSWIFKPKDVEKYSPITGEILVEVVPMVESEIYKVQPDEGVIADVPKHTTVAEFFKNIKFNGALSGRKICSEKEVKKIFSGAADGWYAGSEKSESERLRDRDFLVIKSNSGALYKYEILLKDEKLSDVAKIVSKDGVSYTVNEKGKNEIGTITNVKPAKISDFLDNVNAVDKGEIRVFDNEKGKAIKDLNDFYQTESLNPYSQLMTGNLAVVLSQDEMNIKKYEITLKEKATGEGVDVKATPLLKGEKLADSTLSGDAEISEDGKTSKIPGKFAWKEPQETVNESKEYAWIFTPDDSFAYNSFEGKTKVEIVYLKSDKKYRIAEATVVKNGEIEKVESNILVLKFKRSLKISSDTQIKLCSKSVAQGVELNNFNAAQELNDLDKITNDSICILKAGSDKILKYGIKMDGDKLKSVAKISAKVSSGYKISDVETDPQAEIGNVKVISVRNFKKNLNAENNCEIKVLNAENANKVTNYKEFVEAEELTGDIVQDNFAVAISEDGSKIRKYILKTIKEAVGCVTQPTATAVVAGQKLANSIISGGTFMDANWDKDVEGSCKWKNGEQIVQEEGDFEYVFVPVKSEKFSEYSGRLNVKILALSIAKPYTVVQPAQLGENGKIIDIPGSFTVDELKKVLIVSDTSVVKVITKDDATRVVDENSFNSAAAIADTDVLKADFVVAVKKNTGGIVKYDVLLKAASNSVEVDCIDNSAFKNGGIIGIGVIDADFGYIFNIKSLKVSDIKSKFKVAGEGSIEVIKKEDIAKITDVASLDNIEKIKDDAKPSGGDLIVAISNDKSNVGKYKIVKYFSNFEVTVNDAKVTASAIATGSKLSDSKLTYTGEFNDKWGAKVEGKLYWITPNEIVTKAGVYEYVFKPEEEKKCFLKGEIQVEVE